MRKEDRMWKVLSVIGMVHIVIMILSSCLAPNVAVKLAVRMEIES